MDLSTLRCSLQRNSSFRFTYTLHMKYMQTEWFMEKNFADFEQLQEALLFQDFTDVPLLPDLQLSGGIDPLADLCDTEAAIEKFIREVLRRPDTRSCTDVLSFCDLLRRLESAPAPVSSMMLTHTAPSHLSVSDLKYIAEEKLMIVAYEEKTALSKIGRVWSLIEPEILGSIRIYKLGNDVTEGPTLLLEQPFYSKVRAIDYIREKKTLAVAKDDGTVEMFRLGADATEFESLGSVTLHIGPILSMNVHDGKGFTSGYDDNIRAFDIDRKTTVSGGKLTRRLNGDKLLVSTAMQPSTLMIGTSSNQVYTYYMMDEVPVFVDCCDIPAPMNIRKIYCTPTNVFVAHGNCVSCFGYTRYPVETLRNMKASGLPASRSSDQEMTGINHTKTLDLAQASKSQAGTVCFPMSIRSAQFSIQSSDSSFGSYQVYDVALRSKEKQLLVAYDEVVAIWCIVKGVMLYSWYAHRHAQVHIVRVMEPEGLVLTGGSDGEVRIWRLPPSSQLKLWTPVPA
ncbi:WD G-beta repeat-containing protein protein [Babesia ovis]|uniref:WD G-beta repeat-containing protein protein n=1 Tax=Babesia ovis TaxID=5869 RepID=A0A9W5TB60_BABOV|nr:WD G-beta repeat-containing protein protein [Babesia ovis]